MEPKKIAPGNVKFNYLVGGSRYCLLNGSSGYPSADFKYTSGSGVVVAVPGNKTGPDTY